MTDKEDQDTGLLCFIKMTKNNVTNKLHLAALETMNLP